MKVTRQVPTGLIQIKADAIHIDDCFLRLTLFYRYTGGYRPYILDLAFNACEFVKQTTLVVNNPALNRVFSGIKDVFPRLFDGCPYNVSCVSK